MSDEKLASRWPPAHLPNARAKTGEPALSELLAVTAGNLYAMVGHTYGEAGGPTNPSGGIGHDHTGGEFGRPLFRSIAYGNFGNSALNGASRTVTTNNPRRSVEVAAAGADEDNYALAPLTWAVWVPSCDRESGAFIKADLKGRLDFIATALDSADVVNVGIASLHPQLTPNGLPVWKEQSGVSSPHTTGGKALSILNVDLWPGAWNVLSMRFGVERSGTAGSRGVTIGLDSWALGTPT